MPNPHHLLLALIFINLVAFTLFGVDKLLAKSSKQRISEKLLLLFAVPLSGFGAMLGMVVFNHKTSKPKFRYGVPGILVAQIAFGYWLSFA